MILLGLFSKLKEKLEDYYMSINGRKSSNLYSFKIKSIPQNRVYYLLFSY